MTVTDGEGFVPFCQLCDGAGAIWFNAMSHGMGIGRLRVDPSLCFKARLSAKALIWKLFILMQIKLIFTGKVLHVASFWT